MENFMKTKAYIIRKLCAALSCITLVFSSAAAAGAVGFEDIYKIGDVDLDGTIKIDDCTYLQKSLANCFSLNAGQKVKADVNHDGAVDIVDCTMLQKIIGGIYTPITCKKGVDISSNNGSVNMSKITSAGYDFVMIRCGFGDDYTNQDDSRFEENVAKCEAAGIPWGVYIYSYALNLTEAKSEVAHVKRLLKNKKPTMPVAFDMEDGDGYKQRYGMPSNSMLVKICETFLTEIEKAGYYPILYSNLSWMNNILNNSTILPKYDMWLAQWNSTCDYTKNNLGMWQYGGEVNFIESPNISGVGVVDKNYVYKDYPAIIKNGHYNNW